MLNLLGPLCHKGRLLPATRPAGVLGSLAGGVLLDLVGSSMQHGMLLGAAGLGAGAILVVGAVAAAQSQAAFWLLFALGEAAVFLVQVSE